jgi:hypothetical protein
VSGEALESAHREVLAALTAGRRVGLFHWPRHDEPIDRPIEERIAALVDAGKVQGVAAGEEAAARHVAVHDPEACMHRIDRGPAIAFAALYVISRPSTESSYEPEIVKAHLESLFGSRGEWVSSIPAPPSNANPDYWEQRKHMMYYKYIDVLVRTLAAGARSLIDVGSKRTPLIEAFDWIPRRDALDIVQPYCSSHVRGIKADFLTYGPAERYDFALCLQVLEHIPDAAAFARHLFEVADNVLISVPFMWPEGATAHHVHDPVSLEKLFAWTGRTPSYDVVVAEPLGRSRLIAYFHAPHSTFSLKALREARA